MCVLRLQRRMVFIVWRNTDAVPPDELAQGPPQDPPDAL
jgi:hypothetical protein